MTFEGIELRTQRNDLAGSAENEVGTMSIIRFIAYMGIICLIFNFLWKWIVVVPLSFIVALLKAEKVMYLVKAFGHYLFVSLITILTLYAIHDIGSSWSLVVLPIIGLFVLYMLFASGAYEARKEAMMSEDQELMDNLRYDGLFLIGSLVLYLVALFIPAIVHNPLTRWLAVLVARIATLPIIGWLLGIVGGIFVIAMAWQGILLTPVLIAAFLDRRNSERENFTVDKERKANVKLGGNRISLKFKCSNCGEDIIVRFLKIGETAKCRNCGGETVVPATASKTDEGPDYSQKK